MRVRFGRQGRSRLVTARDSLLPAVFLPSTLFGTLLMVLGLILEGVILVFFMVLVLFFGVLQVLTALFVVPVLGLLGLISIDMEGKSA